MPPKKRRSRAAEHRAIRDAMDYDKLFAAQNGRCAICLKPPKKRKLDRDHSHRRKLGRGLLCAVCNRHLSTIEDPAWLRAAAEYLERYEKGESE